MQGLKKMRKDCNLTQRALAKILGIATSTVSMWEKIGTLPRKAMLDKLCAFFHCKVDDLL